MISSAACMECISPSPACRRLMTLAMTPAMTLQLIADCVTSTIQVVFAAELLFISASQFQLLCL